MRLLLLLTLIVIHMVDCQDDSQPSFKSIRENMLGFVKILPTMLKSFGSTFRQAARNEMHKKVDRFFNASERMMGSSSIFQ